jgi:hypothetical protein
MLLDGPPADETGFSFQVGYQASAAKKLLLIRVIGGPTP